MSRWPPNYPQRPDVADHQYATDDGLAFYDLGGFLVRTGDRVVLVDAGAGPARTSAGVREPGAEAALEALLRGRGLEVWDTDEPIAPGVDVVLAPGHTPGSTLVMVASRGEWALLLGDIVHCPLELPDEEFVLLGAVDQELADRSSSSDGCSRVPDGRTWSRAA